MMTNNESNNESNTREPDKDTQCAACPIERRRGCFYYHGELNTPLECFDINGTN
jgi:hypothetical protein